MIKGAEAVLADALRLDLDARAQVAVELLASLDDPTDPDAEALWAVEIERRVAAIETGTVKLEPWEDVKRRVEKEILGRCGNRSPERRPGYWQDRRSGARSSSAPSDACAVGPPDD